MTGADWLACSEPKRMLAVLKEGASERKLRLFGAACCRRAGEALATPQCQRAIEVAERHADGLAAPEEVENVRDRNRVRRARRGKEYAATLVLSDRPDSAGAWLVRSIDPFARADVAAEMSAQAAVLREVFGNPFRLITFDSEWRTDTVTALAAQMYETRDFSAMPILADALQDAGCAHADILAHCQDARQVHVRGCWAVDLVLGKE